MERPTSVQQLTQFLNSQAELFSAAQKKTGMLCPSGCIQCCTYPEIEATPFEMLPMAYSLLEQGLAESVLQEITDSDGERCVLLKKDPLNPQKGFCSQYQDRPLVCRTFGVAARNNKYRAKELLLCGELKKLYPHEAQDFQSRATELPLISEASQGLLDLDPRSLQERQRISKSLAVALEKVLHLSHLVMTQSSENT